MSTISSNQGSNPRPVDRVALARTSPTTEAATTEVPTPEQGLGADADAFVNRDNPGARWSAFAGVQTAQTLPGGFRLPDFQVPQLPNPIEAGQDLIENTVEGGFETFRDYLQGPIEVSEDLELASGLPAHRVEMNGQRGTDGAGDALKHVTHAALIQFVAPNVAPSLLQGKEHYQGGEAAVMDRHNNEVGFRIGREAREAVSNGEITREQAPEFIINRVIEEFDRAQDIGSRGDIEGEGPYWLRNHGFQRLDDASTTWREDSREAIVNNSERALETNFPWDNVQLPWQE